MPVFVTKPSVSSNPLRTQFLAELGSARSSRTVEAYGESTAQFERFLTDNGTDIVSAPPGAVQAWVLHLVKHRRVSAATVRFRVAAVQQYVRWLTERGLRTAPMIKPKMPRLREKVPPILRGSDLEAYLGAAKTLREPYATALLMLPMTGLRRTEMAQLRMADVTIVPRVTLHVRGSTSQTVKGATDRLVPPLKAARPVLVRYVVHTRPHLRLNEWLFPMARGGHISSRMISAHVKDIGKSLKIRDLTAHTLRHTFATTLKEAGVSDFWIQKILGHRNANTTAKYLHPSMETLADAVDSVKAGWAEHGAR